MASPRIHFRLPSDHLINVIRSLAVREKKTISQVVRELIMEGLEARARKGSTL